MVITKAQIDELVGFLPRFENPGPELAATWSSLEPDPVTGVVQWPHPRYPSAVNEFFRLAAQPWWCDVEYDPAVAQEMISDDSAIEGASLPEIKAMLNWCVRGERFSDGLWDSVVKDGRVAAILRRLVVLTESDAGG